MASSSNAAMAALKGAGQEVMKSLGNRAISSASDRVSGLTEKFEDIGKGGPLRKPKDEDGDESGSGSASGSEDSDDSDSDSEEDGGGGVLGGIKGAFSKVKDKVTPGGGGGGNKSPKATKAMNIIESLDVGVPLRVAYNQWTTFDQFPSFMKKVETVDDESDDEPKMKWKAQVFWSHREWEATIKEQVPDERIVWTSTGAKGRVDGGVSFHELGPNLTRILLVLEYYPQGFMERTGNIWRAAGRRARLEFKHFRRHVMTRTILDPDAVEGWRGTIHDGEIVQTHEEALEEEQNEQDEGEDQDEEGYDDEYDESEEPEESEESEESGDAEDEDEYGDESEDEDADEEEEDADEEEAPEEEPAPRRRRRRAA